MATPENAAIRRILKNQSRDRRLFRINSGTAWQGEILQTTAPRTLILKNPRMFHGAPQGTPDLCGWTTVKITPEMVGDRVAVFTGVEVKSGRNKTLNPAQKRARDIILAMGGIWEMRT